jgi:hypothetical protein
MEPYFSESGDIHTAAKHNRLSVQKTAKLATVGVGIKHSHAASGESWKWLKQSYGVPVHSDTEKDPSGCCLNKTELPSDPEPDSATESKSEGYTGATSLRTCSRSNEKLCERLLQILRLLRVLPR